MSEFEEIYTAYYDDVFKFVLTLCKDKTMAEDITQETFLKAINNINSFKNQCKFKVWLCQIAKNYYFSLYKKNKKNRESTFLEHDFEMESPERKLVEREAALEVHKALHKLDDPYKEVFTLRIFGELSFLDIGMLFGKSDSWSRVTFYRAKMKIKEATNEKRV